MWQTERQTDIHAERNTSLCSASYVSWQCETARICCCAAIDRYLLPDGPTAANPPQWLAVAEWREDRWIKNRWAPDSFTDPAPHTMQAVLGERIYNAGHSDNGQCWWRRCSNMKMEAAIWRECSPPQRRSTIAKGCHSKEIWCGRVKLWDSMLKYNKILGLIL